jgi:outer membrane receptor for Fe3+-dicitrate
MQQAAVGVLTTAAFTLCSPTLHAADVDAAEKAIEEIIVIGQAKTFSAMSASDAMRAQQNPITSILATVDNLPGVNITEGDTFGFDDWSTTVNIRGYQTSLSEQQVGMTIDGFPNGDSNYGGGAKANRYIDSANLGGVEVSQGTADISSRSTESLGGTLNFTTIDPLENQRMQLQTVLGDFNSKRYYARFDTGRILNDSTVAWVSYNHNEATDWVEGSAQNERDHVAGKFVTSLERYTITGYFAYDDIQEDNYQRITRSEFDEDPQWDRLIGNWTQVPYVNQLHRRAWSTLRENKFGYLKLDAELTDNLSGSFGVYLHTMQGRGDWVPPYIGNVTDDAGGPESELGTGPTVSGGSLIGRTYFVDASGTALTPAAGCVSSITFPYGGAGAEYDPACYAPGAIPVQSYRHTHYERDRLGYTADLTHSMKLAGFDNTIRAGLWYEDSTRLESRDWHKLTDARVGAQFDNTPYWIQYDREFPRETLSWYLQDVVSIDNVTINLGIRQFDVSNEERDLFGVAPGETLESKSNVLFSGGATYATPVDGLELFLGYSENVKPLLDLVLEREGSAAADIEAETTKNTEFGLRFVGNGITASAVYFDNAFDNRLEFFGPQDAGNIPDYDIGLAGRFDNVGGIETKGFELATTVLLGEHWSVYGAVTTMKARYVGTGLGAAADAVLGLTAGNTVVNTPDDMVVMSIDWQDNKYSAGLSNKLVGRRFIDRSNTSSADAYITSDLYVAVTGDAISDGLQGYELRLVVNNLFDESYLGGIAGFGAWIGSPRTAVISLTVDI